MDAPGGGSFSEAHLVHPHGDVSSASVVGVGACLPVGPFRGAVRGGKASVVEDASRPAGYDRCVVAHESRHGRTGD